MRQTIWVQKGEEVEFEVTAGPSYRNKFIKALVEYITEALRTSWGDKKTVEGLMVSAIERDVMDLLNQFLHSQLEIIGRSFNTAFDIEAEIETGHAPHAKMNQFIDAIKAKCKNGPGIKRY